MDLRQLQQEQKEWQQKNFGDHPEWHPFFGMVEELGELAHARLKLAQGIRMHEPHIENAKDAVGDFLVFLADFCNQAGFDLQECLDETWAKVKQRDWKKDPNKAHKGLGDTDNVEA